MRNECMNGMGVRSRPEKGRDGWKASLCARGLVVLGRAFVWERERGALTLALRTLVESRRRRSCCAAAIKFDVVLSLQSKGRVRRVILVGIRKHRREVWRGGRDFFCCSPCVGEANARVAPKLQEARGCGRTRREL